MANADGSRGAATEPSDPLDAALAKMEAAMATSRQESDSDDLELDDDETTGTNTTTVADPDDDDSFDDDDTDVANTPEDSEEDDEDSLEQQSDLETTSSAKPADPKNSSKGGAQESDDISKLSRKGRGKLIEELRQEIERANEDKEKLERALEEQRKADAELDAEINRALGTDEEYERATEDGLSGDRDAAERARVWKANRAFYHKLVNKSKKETEKEFMSYYWKDVSGLPGIDEKVLAGKPLADILKHVYDAGSSSVGNSHNETIEQLRKEVDTWKGRYKALKPKSGGNKRSPVSGGDTASPPGEFNWRDKYLDKNGLPTDEFETLVERYGFDAVVKGRIPGNKAR